MRSGRAPRLFSTAAGAPGGSAPQQAAAASMHALPQYITHWFTRLHDPHELFITQDRKFV